MPQSHEVANHLTTVLGVAVTLKSPDRKNVAAYPVVDHYVPAELSLEAANATVTASLQKIKWNYFRTEQARRVAEQQAIEAAVLGIVLGQLPPVEGQGIVKPYQPNVSVQYMCADWPEEAKQVATFDVVAGRNISPWATWRFEEPSERQRMRIGYSAEKGFIFSQVVPTITTWEEAADKLGIQPDGMQAQYVPLIGDFLFCSEHLKLDSPVWLESGYFFSLGDTKAQLRFPQPAASAVVTYAGRQGRVGNQG